MDYCLRRVWPLGAAALLLASCHKKEDGYIAPQLAAGTKTIEMGSTLENQVFVDLGTGTVVSRPATSWDLAFENKGSLAIRSNTSEKASVYTSASTDFAAVTAVPSAASFKYDDPSGNLAKTAVGSWGDANGVSAGKVYIINLGNNPPTSATARGYRKFKITGYSNGAYSLRYANLDGTGEQNVQIPVNAATNFTYFSLLNNKIVDVEPPKGTWDVVFTGYSIPGGGAPGSYVVTVGALTNRYDGVQVATDNPAPALTSSDDPAAAINQMPSSSSHYATLTKADYVALGNASPDATTIGRSWWQILQPHSSGVYKVYDWKTYIVKDTENRYYKLRFNTYKGGPNVTVGYPAFEYQEL